MSGANMADGRGFRLPGGDARTAVIGATGTGKTVCGTWLLSRQRFDARPWVAVDWKREAIFDDVGFPPITVIDYGTVPKKPGLYLLQPNPGEEEQVEEWLWDVWKQGNVGLYLDEAALMPDKAAMRAILQQGRSKRLPVIACMQRPVGVSRAFFSEASFFCCYRLQDSRDYKTLEGLIPTADMGKPLPAYHWRWYDVARNLLLSMQPVPSPDRIVADLSAAIPYQWHPFAWLRRHPTGRRG